MLSDEDLLDGLVFRKAMELEGFQEAMEHLARNLNDDAIARWAGSESKDGANPYSKKWLRGYRECASAIVPVIEQRVKDAVEELEARRQERDVTRSKAEDGIGSGDLAIS